jgi:PAS domain S-box-containing protein
MSPYVVVVDRERRYVEVTDAVCELLGYTREQMLAMRIDDISAPSGAHAPAMFDKFVNDGKMRGWYLLKDSAGREVHIDFVAEALPDGRYRAEWTPHPEHTGCQGRAKERA